LEDYQKKNETKQNKTKQNKLVLLLPFILSFEEPFQKQTTA
jgi:hypothetical protein